MTSALHLTDDRIDYKGLALVKFITGSSISSAKSVLVLQYISGAVQFDGSYWLCHTSFMTGWCSP
jgi:hypothetical protein